MAGFPLASLILAVHFVVLAELACRLLGLAGVGPKSLMSSVVDQIASGALISHWSIGLLAAKHASTASARVVAMAGLQGKGMAGRCQESWGVLQGSADLCTKNDPRFSLPAAGDGTRPWLGETMAMRLASVAIKEPQGSHRPPEDGDLPLEEGSSLGKRLPWPRPAATSPAHPYSLGSG